MGKRLFSLFVLVVISCFYASVVVADRQMMQLNFPPEVVSVDPPNKAKDVPAGMPPIRIDFSIPMNQNTVNESSFRLFDSAGQQVEGNVVSSELNLKFFRFYPKYNLKVGTTYTVEISKDVKGINSGIKMRENFSSSFTTAANIDTSIPQATEVYPGRETSGIELFPVITAKFSKAMDDRTITMENFIVQSSQGAAKVDRVMYDFAEKKAMFYPYAYLLPLTTYTVTLTETSIKDVSGNPINKESWTFTTKSDEKSMVYPATLISRFPGVKNREKFGFSVTGMDFDFDGDGVQEIVVGSPGAEEGKGKVTLISGKTGQKLALISGMEKGENFGHSLSTLVPTSNGSKRLLIGAPRQNLGSTGGIYEFLVYKNEFVKMFEKRGVFPCDNFGFSITGMGDVNGDNVSDFAVGAPAGLMTNNGAVYVYSGHDQKLLYRIEGTSPRDLFGYSISVIDDTTGDSVSDLVVGVPNYGAQNQGRVYIFSGKEGNLSWSFGAWGKANGYNIGKAVASLPKSFLGLNWGIAGVPGNGAAKLVRQEADGDAESVGIGGLFSNENFGDAVGSAGDVNGDGNNDIIIGAPKAKGKGVAYVFSGKDRTLMCIVEGENQGDDFGSAVGSLGDLNNDGKSEFFVGAPQADGNEIDSGAVYIYSLSM